MTDSGPRAPRSAPGTGEPRCDHGTRAGTAIRPARAQPPLAMVLATTRRRTTRYSYWIQTTVLGDSAIAIVDPRAVTNILWIAFTGTRVIDYVTSRGDRSRAGGGHCTPLVVGLFGNFCRTSAKGAERTEHEDERHNDSYVEHSIPILLLVVSCKSGYAEKDRGAGGNRFSTVDTISLCGKIELMFG